MPEDNLKKYEGQMICEHFWNDVMPKITKGIYVLPEGPERDAAFKEATEVHFVAYLKQLEKSLGASKYLVGDTLTIYDFQIAGHFYNLFCNPNAKNAAAWKAAYDANVPARVKQYVDDFGAEMKDYLDKRGFTNTM